MLRADAGARGASELWIKNDGLTHPRYGGNKLRKLEHVLPEAKRRGARRIVTLGAAGSHHVLATTLFAKEHGLRVAAVLFPQPHSAHAELTLSVALAHGLQAEPAPSLAGAIAAAARLLQRGDFLLPAGGSNVTGTLGYLDAAVELAGQIRAGELPLPDAVMVALGSGGTAGGLLAGFALAGIATRVVAVSVLPSFVVGKALVVSLAAAALRRTGSGERRSLPALGRALAVDTAWLGRGYGFATPEGDHATAVAAGLGIELDPTYTAKTFAAALARTGAGPTAAARRPSEPQRILYWHTLSSAPLEPLLTEAQRGVALPPELSRLLVRR